MASGAELTPTVDFLAGTLAGTAGLVAGFPFDTVKVRLQTPELAGHYRGSTAHAIATIVQEERVLGLYKGITSPLLTVALMNGLLFASYNFFLRLQSPLTSDASLAQIALAGVGSGIVSAAITTPTELVKIRQQQFTGASTARSVAAGIVKAGGIVGLYRGSAATVLRDAPGYAAYFASYEATARALSTPGEKRAGGWQVLVAGGVAGIVGWLATFPMDVVKTRVQGSGPGALLGTGTSLLAGTNPPVNPYRTTWSAIVNSYRAEGLPVFYRGLAPTLIRAVPVNVVTFGVFEFVVSAFG